MIYAYIRVSTDKQHLDNQRYEIERFAKENKIIIDHWVGESVSGTKEVKDRELGKIIKRLKKGDILICSELSRLGRTLFMIMNVLSYCLNKDIHVYTVKENFRLGDDISSKVLAFAFGISAEIERKLISERTKEGLIRVKKEGKKLGRPNGSKNKNPNKKIKEDILIKMLNDNLPVTTIAKRFKVHPNTLYKYIKENKQNIFID